MPDKIIVSAPGPQGPAGGGGGGGVTDGDKGDLTVSGGGTVYTIDAGAITTAKLADSSITAAKVSKNGVTFEKFQQLTGPVLVGREAATAGDAEALALGSNLSISSGTLQVTLPTAGTGITGSSTFSVDFAPDGTTSTTKAVRADDSRLSDARTPTAHTHALADLQQGGATTNQVVTWNGSAWVPSSPSGTGTVTSVTGGTGLSGGTITTSGTLAVSYGTTSGTACEGNDSRLSDARTPTTHTHAPSDIQQGGATSGQVLEWSGSVWAPATLSGGGGGTVTSVTAGTGLTGGTITGTGTIAADFGTASGTICQGNDSRLSDARTPTAHNHSASEVTSGTLDIGRIPTGTTSSTVCIGNDARLSDNRTPTAHTHALADIQQGGATTGQVLEWSGSAWAPATPSGGGGSGAPPANKKYVVFEHFVTNTTTPRDMVYAATGGTVGSSDIRSDGRLGGVNISTGTTASTNQHATWRMSNNSTIGDFEDLASAQYSTEIKGLNLGDGTTTGIVYVGLGRFSSTPGSDPSHGVYLRSTDGGNWYAVTRASGTETATDTGVGTNTTAWQRLTVKYTSSSCTFYIDGTLEATHTTNIPTLEANFGMSIVKTAAVSSQIRYTVDWLYADLEYDPALSLD
jgi:hypothetical protein